MRTQFFMLPLLTLLILPITLWTQTNQELTADEKSELLFMMEEEKMARDIYVVLFEKWGNKAFDNISKAEQKHLDKLKEIASNHEIEIPRAAEDDKQGIFNDEELQALYNKLMDSGNMSMTEALQVGVQTEETDIEDLQQALKETDHPELIKVYSKLLEASNRHLAAFQKNLDKKGVSVADQENGKSSTGEKTCCKEGEGKSCKKDNKAEKVSETTSSKEKGCCKNRTKDSCKNTKSKS